MDLQLTGRTAVVTGASGGIGQAIALALAGEGVKLCIVARREDKLQTLADEIAALGPAAEPIIIAADRLKKGLPRKCAPKRARSWEGSTFL